MSFGYDVPHEDHDATVVDDDIRWAPGQMGQAMGPVGVEDLGDEDFPRSVWSTLGPAALALGLLVLAVAVGTYIGLRSADDRPKTDLATWPDGGTDGPAESGRERSEESDSDDAAATTDDEASTGEDVAAADASAGEATTGEATQPGTEEGAAGSSTTEPAGSISSQARPRPIEDTGPPTTDGPPDPSIPPPDDWWRDQDECEWSPGGRHDHRNRDRRCDDGRG